MTAFRNDVEPLRINDPVTGMPDPIARIREQNGGVFLVLYNVWLTHERAKETIDYLCRVTDHWPGKDGYVLVPRKAAEAAQHYLFADEETVLAFQTALAAQEKP
jgi:hypothetical protein